MGAGCSMSLCPRRPQIKRARLVAMIETSSSRLSESPCADRVARKTPRRITLLDGSSKNVYDEVRSNIDEQEVATHESVLEDFRSRGQHLQDAGGHVPP